MELERIRSAKAQKRNKEDEKDRPSSSNLNKQSNSQNNSSVFEYANEPMSAQKQKSYTDSDGEEEEEGGRQRNNKNQQDNWASNSLSLLSARQDYLDDIDDIQSTVKISLVESIIGGGGGEACDQEDDGFCVIEYMSDAD